MFAGRTGRVAAVLLVVGLIAGTSAAGEPPHKAGGKGTLEHGMIHGPIREIGANYMPTLIIRWKLDTLVGEPLVYCDVTWFISKNQYIPDAVLAQLRFLHPVIDFTLGPNRDTGSADVWHLECDPGVPSQPLFRNGFEDPLVTFRNLSASERERAVSFNVTGSPSWSKLFKHSWGKWVSKEDAERRMKDGIPTLKVNRVYGFEYDVSALTLWQQHEAKARTEKAESDRLAALTRQRDAKHEQAKQLSDDDFWKTPDSDETTQEDEQERQLRAQFEKKLAKHQQDIAKTEATRSAYDQKIEQHRQAVLNKRQPKVGQAQQSLLALIAKHSHFQYGYQQCGTYSTEQLSARLLDACRLQFERAYSSTSVPSCRHYTNTWSAAIDFRRDVVSAKNEGWSMTLQLKTPLVTTFDGTSGKEAVFSILLPGETVTPAERTAFESDVRTLVNECPKLNP